MRVNKLRENEGTIYYQFLSSHNAITNLEGKMIKVSSIKKVNDLFELRPYLRFDRRKRKEIEKIRTRVADIYGMVCFSTDWQEPIMWSHYADCNKGIVLGFEVNRLDIKPVEYPAQRKRVSLDPGRSSPSEYIEAVGFIKYESWSYEKEHRFFVRLEDCVNIEGNYFLKFGNDLELKKVIIGPAHPCKKKRNYVERGKYIAELVKETGAELIVSRPEFGGYRIVRDGLWTSKFEELLKRS
jgi:hypothetical protein